MHTYDSSDTTPKYMRRIVAEVDIRNVTVSKHHEDITGHAWVRYTSRDAAQEDSDEDHTYAREQINRELRTEYSDPPDTDWSLTGSDGTWSQFKPL